MIWGEALPVGRAGKWTGTVDFSLSWLLVLLCLLLAIPASADMEQSYPNLHSVASGNAFASAPILDSAVLIPLISETRLDIPAPSASALASKLPNQIGVAVDIPAGQMGLPGLALDSAWTKRGERQYARLTIHSPGAVSVRAGVAISSRFPGRALSVSGSGKAESELKRLDGLSWSSISDGDTLTLLLDTPAGYRYREGDIFIPVVSHIDTDPLSANGNGFANIYPETASCAVDIACAKTTVQQATGASVMKILFTKNGNTYACSGTMLADAAHSHKPYVYTANHCIGSQAVADTVITLWNLQYASCSANNSGAPLGAVKLSNGAQLLSSNSDNDYSFLLLNDAPPTGSSFSGWNSDPLTSGNFIASIGHPYGDVKKIALGAVNTPSSSAFLADGITISSAWSADISEGVLQPGSSGGGLFTCDTQGCYLRGGVIGGDIFQACTHLQAASFSRFDVAYQTIKPWLHGASAGPIPISLTFSGWPQSVDSSTTVPMGTVTAVYSDGSSKALVVSVSPSNPNLTSLNNGNIVAGETVVASISSSNRQLLSLKNGNIFTSEAIGDTPISLTVRFTENGATVTDKIAIMVKSIPIIKTKPLVAAGILFSLGLRSDGTVWGWGNNRYASLGKSTYYPYSYTPVKIFGISEVIGLSASYHVLALKTDGTVWSWGSSLNGALGTGTVAFLGMPPTQVNGISGVSAVAAGEGFSAALKSDGTVWSWGGDEALQLGDGSNGTASSTPVQATGITNAKAIAVGGLHTIALLQDGTVMAWGNNEYGQLGTVTNDQCSYHVFGTPYTDNCSKTPIKIAKLDNVVAVASGSYHVLALRADGTVWAWGLNDGGQLGDGTTSNSSVPKPVPGLTGVVAIAAGDNHSLALRSDGTVWAWGWNSKRQLGYASASVCTSVFGRKNVSCSNTPAPVLGLADVSTISAGGDDSLALEIDGSVWVWGDNMDGQIGNNTTTSATTPVRVVGPSAQGFLDLGTSQVPVLAAPPAVATPTPLDCLFTWAENSHPDLFSPSGVNTETQEIYNYRFYSTTRAYLSLSSSDDHLYYLGPLSADRMTDLGAVSSWYTKAGCR